MSVALRWQVLRELIRRYATVFSHAWRARAQHEPVPRKPYEIEFLPATLALQEAPVSPTVRATMWVLLSLLAATVAWSIVGNVELVAIAHGKIVPDGRSKVVQSMESAVVKNIYVRDGQRVLHGETLIELDSANADADVAHVEMELGAARLQVARAKALLSTLERGSSAPVLVVPEYVGTDAYAQAEELLKGQFQEYSAKVARLLAQAEAEEAALEAARELVTSLEQSVPITRQRALDLKKLSEANLAARHEYLEREQQRLEQEGSLASQVRRIEGLKASLRAIQAERLALTRETTKAALTVIEESQLKATTLEQELIKARTRGSLMKLTAPVDGTVQQLAAHTVGGVVTAAQPLMTIVPQDGPLEIEAFLENKDVGFVREGQNASVKVAAFPYTKYGTLDGTVVSVSRDAIEHEKLGPIYSMRVRMKENAVYVDGHRIGLGAGMATTVEVKTGTKRVIEYFLSPLLQRTSESLRER